MNDRIMDIKLVVEDTSMFVVSAYAPRLALRRRLRRNFGRTWMSWFEEFHNQRGFL